MMLTIYSSKPDIVVFWHNYSSERHPRVTADQQTWNKKCGNYVETIRGKIPPN